MPHDGVCVAVWRRKGRLAKAVNIKPKPRNTPRSRSIADAFSHRIPPVQYMRTFLSLPDDVGQSSHPIDDTHQSAPISTRHTWLLSAK